MAKKLSLEAQFDDLKRTCDNLIKNNVLGGFLEFCKHQENNLKKLKNIEDELSETKNELSAKNEDIKKLEMKLTKARNLIDQEIRFRREIEDERNVYKEKLDNLREMVLNESAINNKRDTLEFLKSIPNYRTSLNDATNRLNTIKEADSTGSLLSDLSFTRSEDDLDEYLDVKHRRQKYDEVLDSIPVKKFRKSDDKQVLEISSNEKIVATTTVSLRKKGPIHATSTLETVPIDSKENTPPVLECTSQNAVEKFPTTYFDCDTDTKCKSPEETPKILKFTKEHNMQPKTVIRSEVCSSCDKKIKFGKPLLKCKDCRTVCHPGCELLMNFACIPLLSTPKINNRCLNSINDYVSIDPPLIPPIIIHCIQEIESRGVDQIGLYRIPGSEKEVKTLKEKFLKGKSIPNLSAFETAVICGTIKDFFRSLSDPLIPQMFWNSFIDATNSSETTREIHEKFMQLIDDLPHPNRDTLAYLILHLQKIANNPDSKMPVTNLARVFAPTIVGYSTADVQPPTMLEETEQQVKVMEYLLKIKSTFWSEILSKSDQMNMLKPSSSTISLTPSLKSLFNTPSTSKF